MPLLLITLYSCKPNELSDKADPVSDPANQIDPFFGAGKPMRLGKKLPNPYSIDNMRAAFREIQPKWKQMESIASMELRPTDYYVQFQANTYEEWDALKADTTYLFLDFPIDYEIEEGGDYFHDPSVPPTVPTFNYAVLTALEYPESPLPNMRVREELLIPEHLPEVLKLRMDAEVYENLLVDWEAQAFKRLGYGTGKTENDAEIKNRWQPGGKIETMEDDGTRVPVKGAKIVFWSFARIKKAVTRSDGTFSYGGPGFLAEVKYTIKWEQDDYDIRSGNFFQAWTFGPKLKGPFNRVLHAGKEQLFGDVHRAAHFYYYEQKELNTPPKISWLRMRTQIGAFDRVQWTPVFSAPGSYLPYRKLFGMRFRPHLGVTLSIPEIKIFKSNDASHIDIVSTTLHELAHASHARGISPYSFGFLWVNNKTLCESWAWGVEWYLTKKIYRELGKITDLDYFPSYVIRDKSYQYWLNQPQWVSNKVNQEIWAEGYKPLFIDVHDAFNQKSIGGLYLNDNLTERDFAFLETIMHKSRSIQDFKDHLITGRPSLNAKITEYFNQY